MAPLEIRHRSVRPISAKHAQASRFLQQSLRADGLLPRVDGRYLPTVFRHADRLDRVLGAIGADAHSRAVCDFSQAARTRKPSQGELAHAANRRSEEHTSELQSLMRTSYAGFC